MSVSRSRGGEFYVGYHPSSPPGTGRFIRGVVIMIAVACVAIPVLFAWAQQPFSTSAFEFGSLRELTGFVTREPVPMLRVVAGREPSGDRVLVSLPLLAAGKFGGGRVVDAIEDRSGRSLEGLEVTLRGTLVYHDGKALFELTEGEDSLVEILPASQTTPPEVKTESLGRTVVRGEIVDSKCYFGVMKPGLGKPHRSCAIRCIAGGIPPVLMVRNAEGEADYLLLVGPSGEPVNDEILQKIAIPVEVEGELERFDDWLLMRVDPGSGIRTVST